VLSRSRLFLRIHVQEMQMTRLLLVAGTGLAFTLMATAAAAQDNKGSVIVEGGGGHVVFGDDGAIDHSAFGARVRTALTSRITAGPEFVYMRGPGRDRDLFILGGLSFDILRERRITPYATTMAGLMLHGDAFNSWSEFAFIVGAGARIMITDRFFVAMEGRLGVPLHAGLGGSVGYRYRGWRSNSRR
jgi:hypothetical protein